MVTWVKVGIETFRPENNSQKCRGTSAKVEKGALKEDDFL